MSDFVLKEKDGIWYGVFPRLEAMGIIHGFTCRVHGESDLVPGELNMALHVGDTKDLVCRNREKVGRALGIDAKSFTTCAQVHGTKIAIVTAEQIGSGAYDFSDTIKDTDALVTSLAGVPLMLFFADCVPVMLVDYKRKIIALAHAGWRGSVGEIVLKTISKMTTAYGTKPEDLIAAIGPSIGRCCYEVDSFVYEQGKKYKECFSATDIGHWQLDLWSLNQQQLLAAGVARENILCAEVCTADNKEFYFSYRAENGCTGRLAAIISLPKAGK